MDNSLLSDKSFANRVAFSYLQFHFPWFENIKWEIPENKVLNCTLFWVAWWSLARPHSGRGLFLHPADSASLLIAISVIRSTAVVSQRLSSSVILILLDKHKSSGSGDSNMPKRSQTVLLGGEKLKVFDMRKKNRMPHLLRHTVILNLLFLKFWGRKKKSSFAVTFETAKVMATMHKLSGWKKHCICTISYFERAYCTTSSTFP